MLKVIGFRKRVGALVGVLSVASLVFVTASPSGAGAAVATPAVSGPITGGAKGRPFGTAIGVDLKKYNYVEQEYFFSGSAATYKPADGATFGPDGKWNVVPSGATQPFTTRMLVRRPADRKAFNGTVIVLWMNTTAGFEIGDFAADYLLKAGYAWVGVSAQREGLEGTDATAATPGLKKWDPQRYGTLNIASNDAAFDIFSQAGRLVGPNRGSLPIDPLAGLPVARVIADGGSQSAWWLSTYYNAVQPLEHVFDGFELDGHFGTTGLLAAGVKMPQTSQLRNDVPEPVMVRNSENEMIANIPARQPDSATFRLWEYAGLNHSGGLPGAARISAYEQREFGAPLALPACTQAISPLDAINMTTAASLTALDKWIRTGQPPASLPRIEVTGTPAAPKRDSLGMAIGGIRIPPVAAPIAVYGAPNTGKPGDQAAQLGCLLQGFTKPIPFPQLVGMYGNYLGYYSQLSAAVNDAIAKGYLLPDDARSFLG
ncbi:MAG: putative signal peptide-containing protein [Acidimicrobiia bacterium]|nr:putative signal peptide-containing protein [Acidimicrobiia bacterium]